MATRVVLAMTCLLETANAELGRGFPYLFNHSMCGVQKGTNQAKGHVTHPGATAQYQRTSVLFLSSSMENSAVARGLEKIIMHPSPKEGQCQRMLQLPYNCTHFTR